MIDVVGITLDQRTKAVLFEELSLIVLEMKDEGRSLLFAFGAFDGKPFFAVGGPTVCELCTRFSANDGNLVRDKISAVENRRRIAQSTGLRRFGLRVPVRVS